MSINSDFEDLLSAFVGAGVRFLVVGGYAFAFHATPRYTRDIDLWIEATPENARRAWAALHGFGAPLAGLSQADLATPGTIVSFGREPARVDLLTHVDGVDFGAAWKRRASMTYGRVSGVPVISEPDLIASKRTAARARDLADVEDLERRARLRRERGDGAGRVSERSPGVPRRRAKAARRRRARP
jgi:hypothetical protein